MKKIITLVSTLLLTLTLFCIKIAAQTTMGMYDIRVSVVSSGSLAVKLHKDLTIHRKVRFVIERSGVTSIPCFFKPEATATPIQLGVGNTTIEYEYAAGGDKLLSFFLLPTDGGGSSQSILTVKQSSVDYQSPDAIWNITTTANFSPTCPETGFTPPPAGYASAYIKYGAGHNNQLVRPIIFVDGIDFSTEKFTDPNRGNAIIRHGATGWDVISLGLEDSPLDPDPENGQPDYETLRAYPAAFQSLLNTSTANGGDSYDIIFLDFSNGTDYIQRNSLLLQELIRRVNQAKVANAQGHIYKNVVLGASMGGLVARHALASMEKQGENHCTHTYVSFDAPQKGANIPLSLQAMGWFLGATSDDLQAKSFWENLSSPAARQLLINHFGKVAKNGILSIEKLTWSNDFNTTIPQDFACLRDAFVAELAELGYPKDCRNIAIACGSILGNSLANQGFSAGSELFDMHFHASSFGQVAQIQLYAQGSTNLDFASSHTGYYVMSRCNPNAGLSRLGMIASTNNLIFAGAVPANTNRYLLVTETPCSYNGVVVRNNSPFAPNFDHVQGCKRRDFPTLKRLFKGLAESSDADVNFNLEEATYKRSFCFMPTMSTLDLNWEMTQNNLERAFRRSEALVISPFKAIYAPDGQFDNGKNLKHVELTANMLSWLQSELQIGESAGGLAVTLPNTTAQQLVFAQSGVISRNYSVNQNGAIVLNGDPSVIVGINGCSAPVQVNVNAGGNFNIGSNTTLGQVLAKASSSVKIGTNGNLRIAQNSALIVESGAKLILEGGANIVLDGKIHIKQGGELIVNGQFNHSGNGYFEFDEGHILRQTAPFVLRGGGSEVKLIQLNRNAQLAFTHTVNLSNGLILYDNYAGISQNTGDLTLSNLYLKPGLADINQIAYNAQNVGNVNVSDVTFQRLYKGLIIHNLGNATISRTNFIGCKSDNLTLQNGGVVKLNQVNISGFGEASNHPIGIGLAQLKEVTFDYVNVDPYIETMMFGNENRRVVSTVYGIVLNDIPIFRFRNSAVGYCQTGIKADQGKNNIDMKLNSTVKNSSFGILLNGERLPNGITNYGRLTMSCSNLLDNGWGISGRDIELNIDANSSSGNTSNVFRNEIVAGGRARSVLFALEYTYDVPYIKATNNFWSNGFFTGDFFIQTPNGYRSFATSPMAQGIPAHCSVAVLGGVGTDPNCPNPPCFAGGGSTDENSLTIDGETYNLETQYKEAYFDFDNGYITDAYEKFEPLTEISEIDYATASELCKKYIDVSKTMVKSEGLRSSRSKWVTKAKVAKNQVQDNNKLVLYPNPSRDYVQLNIEMGDYEVTLTDALGKNWQTFDSQGITAIEVAQLPNGIYFVSVKNKATQTVQKAKITVSH